MSFALIGPGKLGRVLFQVAAGPRLVIGRSPEGLEPFRDRAELGISTRLPGAIATAVGSGALSFRRGISSSILPPAGTSPGSWWNSTPGCIC